MIDALRDAVRDSRALKCRVCIRMKSLRSGRIQLAPRIRTPRELRRRFAGLLRERRRHVANKRHPEHADSDRPGHDSYIKVAATIRHAKLLDVKRREIHSLHSLEVGFGVLLRFGITGNPAVVSLYSLVASVLLHICLENASSKIDVVFDLE